MTDLADPAYFATVETMMRGGDLPPGHRELRPTWQARGACRGSLDSRFFPERGQSTRAAKAICAVCVVRPACLEFALANADKHGIWGGLSEMERRRLRRQRAREKRETPEPCDSCATGVAS